MKKSSVKLLLLLGLFLYGTGCVSERRLIPAPGASRAGVLQNAAVGRDAGVQILVEAQAWTGRPEVTARVTPLRVTIENKSGNLLRVAYSEFVLIGSSRRYAALPPYAITGTIDEQRLVGPFPSFSDPDFRYNRFSVAPYCAPIYPGIPVYREPFRLDPAYYSRYYTVWTKVQLPTPDMLNKVLPDGVLDEGGSVSGFLYFERISDDEREITFHAELVSATDGRRIGSISIPFVFAEG